MRGMRDFYQEKIDLFDESGKPIIITDIYTARKWWKETHNGTNYASSYKKKLKIEIEFDGCFPVEEGSLSIFSEHAKLTLSYDTYNIKYFLDGNETK